MRIALHYLFATPAFHIRRTYSDQLFLTTHPGLEERPIFLFGLVHFAVRALCFLLRTANTAYINLALEKYHRFIPRHYSKEGRGYFAYDRLSLKEKKDLFHAIPGSVESYIDAYPQILNYQDGDSFLDLGCGRGPNIKALHARFVNSPIFGVDINSDAIDIINVSLSHPNIRTEAADVTSLAYLKGISDNAHDHIVMSHVFSLLIGPGIEATRVLRKEIIIELARIARKTVLIIDGEQIISPTTRFEIEQKNRGAFVESILPYFDAATGATVTLSQGEGYGVLFIKRA